MSRPNFTRERRALAAGEMVCGIDEAGRGPLAGPVVAAAVILNPAKIPKGLNDSKLLNEEKREALYAALIDKAQAFGIGLVDCATIDRINILQATFMAMTKAYAALFLRPTLALIDGNRAPKLSCKTETIIDGDAKCTSIAAASIIAKVTRDRMMMELAAEYPMYGFDTNKGYATPEHLAALEKHGPCPAHRRSFAPLRTQIEAEELRRQIALAL